MTDCLYCGGRYATRDHCPNCGAPNKAATKPETPTPVYWAVLPYVSASLAPNLAAEMAKTPQGLARVVR